LIPVELAPEVHASLRALEDRGTLPPRCHKGAIDRAIADIVRRFGDNTLSSAVRPWDRPETTVRVDLCGSAPDSVLIAMGVNKPADVELEVVSEDLGQGETRTSYRYQWTEDGRSILAEEVKNEIYDGATPYTTYVRGVIVDGDRGVLLTGRDDSALLTEG
jgi:hypothetical protein